ncbi:hypothetical protein SAY86_020419 [Trapa natans]|uniref:PUM-HD domain-containing protein n=1 Tax=Trapa natans TaxID=22666 RepID=A0AAN7M278_TRANT|nr:hypothetical protein SAY86_020419 [Trapa natans]
MGENRREVETAEVDKLLDEIPKATSPHYEDIQPKAIVAGSCRGPYSKKLPENGSLQPRNEEQSLISAIAGLSVVGGASQQAFSMQHLSMHSQMKNSGFHRISEAEIVQDDLDACWINPFAMSGQQVENSTRGISMTNDRVQLVHSLPPVLPVELSMENQEQYLMNTQSLLPYLHLPHIDQSLTTWRSIEHETLHKMWQQRLYSQQLLDHHFEAQHPFQSNVTFGSRRPQFHKIPIPQYQEQPNQEASLHRYGLTGCLKPQSVVFPSDTHAVQAFDRISQQGFSRKNMMRSNGIYSSGPVKSGPINEMANHINQDWRAASNSELYRSFCSPNEGKCFQEDGLYYFKNHNSRLLPVKYNNRTGEVGIKPHLMAKDQHGCRFLQRKISEGGPEDVEEVFIKIIDHMVELMTDPFGNYLIQKLLEVCNEDQKMKLLKVVTRNSGILIQISCDLHGTRVVQKLIETLKAPEQISILVNYLKPSIVILMKNTNGNHVVLRCLQHLTPECNQFVFDAAADYCVELARDRHGCCILQKCLNYSFGNQRNRIIHVISSNAIILSQDPFGNYVVQLMFELDVSQATTEVLRQLEGNFVDLSMQKYSSNVVEKCLEHATEESRGCIVHELLGDPRHDQIMQDPYGNYVIQAALKYSNGTLKSALLKAIEAHVPELRISPYGKKVLSCTSLKH